MCNYSFDLIKTPNSKITPLRAVHWFTAVDIGTQQIQPQKIPTGSSSTSLKQTCNT